MAEEPTPEEPEVDEAEDPAPEDQPVVGYGSFPPPSFSSHAVSLIAQAQLDGEHGWELDWHLRPTADALYGDLRTGTYDMVIAAAGPIASLYNQGVPIKLVAAIAHYPWPFIVRADAGIEEIADLRGMRVGLPRGSLVYGHTLTAVRELGGVDLENDATLVPAEVFETAVQLSRGDVDGAPVLLHQAVELLREAPGEFEVLFDTADSFAAAADIEAPYWYLVIRDDLLEEQPELVDRILEAHRDMAELVSNQPEEAIALLANSEDVGGAGLAEDIGDAHYGAGWEGYKVRYVTIPIDELYEDVQKELQAYVDSGVLEQLPDDGLFYGR